MPAIPAKKNGSLADHVMTLITEQSEMAADGPHQGTLAQQMVAHLLGAQRHTVTGLLSALGRQQEDWSQAYRLYRQHLDADAVFLPILDGVLERIAPNAPLVVAIDDSYLKKTGRQVAGAGWYRDPLGPQFHVNLLYAQRFIQISAAVPDPANPKRSRMIPIGVRLIPKLPKPAKDASPEALKCYEHLKAQNRPGVHALQLLRLVREHLAASGQADRALWVCGDGDYSNSTVLTQLPPRTIYIGRTRNDINLQAVPPRPPHRGVGRPLAYAGKLATPRQLYQDPAIPWIPAEIVNGDAITHVRYKQLNPVKWHAAGEKASVQIVVIAPLRYRKRQHGPWSYTQPAYLVCSQSDLPVVELIQAYFWRWGIEVNFKEEKQIFGTGQAQVRTTPSVATAPAVAIASYAAILLAGLRAYGFHAHPPAHSPPKWYPSKSRPRVTCSALLAQVRQDLVLQAVRNFSPLAPRHATEANPEKSKHGDAA